MKRLIYFGQKRKEERKNGSKEFFFSLNRSTELIYNCPAYIPLVSKDLTSEGSEPVGHHCPILFNEVVRMKCPCCGLKLKQLGEDIKETILNAMISLRHVEDSRKQQDEAGRLLDVLSSFDKRGYDVDTLISLVAPFAEQEIIDSTIMSHATRQF